MSQRFLPLFLSAILCTFSGPVLADGLGDDVVLPTSEFDSGSTQQAGLEGRLFNQTSSKGFDLNGMRGGAYSRWKASESVSGGARVGREAFWRGKTSKDGFYSGGFGQFAWNSHIVTRAELYYHDSMHDFLSGSVSLNIQRELQLWRFAFDRELVYDSYTSLLGTETLGVWTGAARRSLLSISVKPKWKKSEGEFKVSYGYVSARGVRLNRLIGFDGLYKSPFRNSLWSFVSKTQLWGFQRDEGAVGGYFSPQMFFAQGFFMSYQKSLSEKNSATFEIGPAYQYISGSVITKKTHLGGQATFSLSRQLDEKFQIQLQGEYVRTADVYAQTQGMLYVHRVF